MDNITGYQLIYIYKLITQFTTIMNIQKMIFAA